MSGTKTSGRKKIKLDLKRLFHAASIGLPLTDAAKVLGCSDKTLRTKMHDPETPEYRLAWETGKAAGRVDLRLAQRRSAINGLNPHLLIHLGVNELGQTRDGSRQDREENSLAALVLAAEAGETLDAGIDDDDETEGHDGIDLTRLIAMESEDRE